MTVSVSLFGLVPILWSTGTGADVMIPITVPLIGGTITSVIYVLLVTPIVFEMTKQHELRTKGKIDSSMRHIKYYIIISCLLLNVTAAVAQTLSLDAILTNVRTNNPQLKCTMPTYRVWMQHKGARSWMAPQVSTGLFMTRTT
jgi:hypothetical protein